MNILNIRIEITNPFDRWEYFNNLGCVSGRLFGHKAWELEHTYCSTLLLDVEAKLTHKIDHAGFETTIGLLGYGISFRIYDTRHWDDYDKCWKTYPSDNYNEHTQNNS